MKTYRVYFRSDLQWGREDIKARTPAQALKIARRRAEDVTSLDLDYYEPFDNAINEIEVCDDRHDELALWQDDDLRLRLAAHDCSKRPNPLSPAGNAAISPPPFATSMPRSPRRKRVHHDPAHHRNRRQALRQTGKLQPTQKRTNDVLPKPDNLNRY